MSAEVDPNILETFSGSGPMSEDSPQTEFVPFDYNIGTVSRTGIQTFQSGDRSINVSIRSTDSIPPNQGRFVSLQYRLSPDLTKPGEGGRQAVTEPSEVAHLVSEWAKGLNRIIHCLGLDGISKEALANDAQVEQWLARAEGALVVFGAANDKGGFPKVKAFMDSRGAKPTMRVVLRRHDDPAKDNKGEAIPGLTAVEQARQMIAKYRGK